MAITESTARAAVARMSRDLMFRRPEIDRRIGYFKGSEGRLRFASDEFRDYFQKRFSGFSDNWCMPVGQAPAERMNPLGIRLDSDDLSTDKDLQRVWTANEADREVSEAFQVFVVAARSFALVSPNLGDAATPRITFEHPSQAIVEYDPVTRRRRFGLTVWTDDRFDFATLYTDDQVWRYFRSTGVDRQPGSTAPTPLFEGWQPRVIEGEPWPAVNPLGVEPLVELRNQSLLDDDPMSDIGGVMAMQDSINLVWAYLLNGLDYSSLPQRVVLNGEVPRVPVLDKDTGQVVGTRPVELDELIRERIMFLPGENTSIGEWTAAQLNVFSAVIEQAVEHIAAQTRTPPHYLVAKLVNTAAESLTIAEAGLVSKTQERIRYVNPSLREIYRLVALAQGDEQKARAVQAGEMMWADVQYRSEAQRADALQKKRAIGYPIEYLLELDGVPPSDIPRVMGMIQRESELDPVRALGQQVGQEQAGADTVPTG